MRISIGSDHAGFELKEKIKKIIEDLRHQVSDLGPDGAETVDYPDFALSVAQAVSSGAVDCGILICGTGIGMAIVANKIAGVRAAVCHSVEVARLSRRHNDANVLTIGARVVDSNLALEIVREWLDTTYEGEARHARRIQKIGELEKRLQ